MKILGFHVVRELPLATEVEVKIPIPGPASFIPLYEVQTRGEQYRYNKSGNISRTEPPKYAYYKTCIAANKAHPGKSVRQVKAIKAGDHYWLGHGPEVEVLKG